MARQFTCDPGLELNGNSASALIQSLTTENFTPILERHGLARINPTEWYAMPAILGALGEISETPGGMMDLVSIGVAAGELSALPEQVLALPPHDFLAMYCQVFPQRHRGGDPGSMRVERINERSSRIFTRTVYPDDLLYGLLYGLLRRVARGQHIILSYHARLDEDDPETILNAEW